MEIGSDNSAKNITEETFWNLVFPSILANHSTIKSTDTMYEKIEPITMKNN